MAETTEPRDERTELLETLEHHRNFLRFTVRDLTDEEAARRTTVSALCLGGLIKHVADTERGWQEFMAGDQSGVAGAGEGREDQYRLLPGETLQGVLAEYERVAARTEQVARALADLDVSHPLPSAPWFEPGASWTARRVLLHLLAETAQHAGHADILRESLDGQKTMG